MREIPRWMMRDPFEAYARIEEMEQRQSQSEARQKASREGLQDLFDTETQQEVCDGHGRKRD